MKYIFAVFCTSSHGLNNCKLMVWTRIWLATKMIIRCTCSPTAVHTQWWNRNSSRQWPTPLPAAPGAINKIQSCGSSQGVTASATFYKLYVPKHNVASLHVQLLSFVVTLFMARPKQTSFGTMLLDTQIFGYGKYLWTSKIYALITGPKFRSQTCLKYL